MPDNQTTILMKIAGDIGVLTGTVTEIKQQLDRSSAANDQRHDDNEARISALEDSKKKLIYTTLGLSAGGAFAGTKIASVLNTILGIAN